MGTSRRSAAPALLVIVAMAAAPHAGQPWVRGRLLDAARVPLANAVVRPCAEIKRPDGSTSVLFAVFTDGTWATARTDAAGAFVFERQLPARKYCLAVEQRPLDVKVLKDSAGETFSFEVVDKTATLDLGDVVVR